MVASFFIKYDPKDRGKSVAIEGLGVAALEKDIQKEIIKNIDDQIGNLRINGETIAALRKKDVMDVVKDIPGHPYQNFVNFISRHLLTDMKDGNEKKQMANIIASSFANDGLFNLAQDHFDKRIQDSFLKEFEQDTSEKSIKIKKPYIEIGLGLPESLKNGGLYITRHSIHDPWKVTLIKNNKEIDIPIDPETQKEFPNKLPTDIGPEDEERDKIESLALNIAKKNNVKSVTSSTQCSINYDDKTGKVIIGETVNYTNIKIGSPLSKKNDKDVPCNVEVASNISIQLKKPFFNSDKAPSKAVFTVENVQVTPHDSSPGSTAVAATFDLRSTIRKFLDKIVALFSSQKSPEHRNTENKKPEPTPSRPGGTSPRGP